MPDISALFARKNIDSAKSTSDRSRLFGIANLTEDEASNPSNMIPADSYYSLLEAIAEDESERISFHLRTASSMRCEEYGAVGLALKSAPTLRQALMRMDRHARLFNSVSRFGLIEDPDEAIWSHVRPKPNRLGNHLSNEAALATFLTLLREASGTNLSPLRVEFQHSPTGSSNALRAFFGAEILFGCDRDGLVFAPQDLDQPNSVGDEGIWRYFLKQLEADLADTDSAQKDSLDMRAAEVVARLLSGGVPTLADVADGLGIGSRTLQRRLAAQGKTFQSLVDDARKHLALTMVAETAYPFTEIAFLTGFAEQSSFSRAFKRWSGQTPRTYRSAATG